LRCAVPDRELVAGIQEVASDGSAHLSKSKKSNSHSSPQLLLTFG
jgi:hypothetical protein